MFYRTNTLVPGHFIPCYIVNEIFLDNVKKKKNAKKVPYVERVFLNRYLLDIATEQCNKLENGIKLLKSLL